jgi:hypothetical protein
MPQAPPASPTMNADDIEGGGILAVHPSVIVVAVRGTPWRSSLARRVAKNHA